MHTSRNTISNSFEHKLLAETWLACNIPRPREATSVAIRIGDFPVLNSKYRSTHTHTEQNALAFAIVAKCQAGLDSNR